MNILKLVITYKSSILWAVRQKNRIKRVWKRFKGKLKKARIGVINQKNWFDIEGQIKKKQEGLRSKTTMCI